MAIVRRSSYGALLVSEGLDPRTRRPFQRPLGGSVEFGERATDALAREFREELDRELIDLKHVGVIEYGGRPGHEIVFVFEATFADDAAYNVERMYIRDSTDPELHVVWRPTSVDQPPLVPNGIDAYW